MTPRRVPQDIPSATGAALPLAYPNSRERLWLKLWGLASTQGALVRVRLRIGPQAEFAFYRGKNWRPDRESNSGARICSPLRHHSAIRPPEGRMP